MAGIVGYIGEDLTDNKRKLVISMGEAIKYVEDDVVDQWYDKNLAVCRVHHGVVNPEKQPIFNEDKSLLIFMDGEIFGYGDAKEALVQKGHHFKYEEKTCSSSFYPG